MKVRNEDLFAFFGREHNAPPSELGREQFHKHQSFGVKPEEPDPYYLTLEHGKWAFDLLCREYQQLYNIPELWWGFRMLWLDWKGNRWVLPHLLKWYKRELPLWITCEGIGTFQENKS